ncbi:DUF4199 domain-containing protein [Aquimarina spongiae]|uniref:DUF4199 domain-containing protein n=1 Tax=Aquimarina spongiae TaxID=570521 RepID=A0A1M6CC17_9FLAO|nr:DUF4199 domain-containing protein [Aquimarina spongiae]SHI58536.1 Protein of unknown function [Aquimarina spongiae]
MVETTISAKRHILIYGLLLGAIWVLYAAFRNLNDSDITPNWINYVFELSLHIGFTTFGIYKFKSNNDGFLTLRQALKVGFGIALLGAFLFMIWDIFFLKVISPENLHEIISSLKPSVNAETNEKSGFLSKESSYLINRLMSGLIFHLVIGLLVSLLGGAIMQKNPDPFD